MEMQVLYGLKSIVAVVADNPITVFQALTLCDFSDFTNDMSHKLVILRLYIIDTGDVLLGNYQNMNRALGVKILKCDDFVVLINDV